MKEERRQPLEGIVVLDLSRVLAGPVATMILADLGARVVKVEDPRGGDFSRGWKPPALDGESAYFLSVNRRKESAAVDLGTSGGAEFVRRWAKKADVLVESFVPGALERRGLGVEALRSLNPRLVACSTNAARVTNRKELVPVLEEAFGKEPRAVWLERCKSAGIPAGPVAGVLEAIRSPQASALGSILEVAGTEGRCRRSALLSSSKDSLIPLPSLRRASARTRSGSSRKWGSPRPPSKEALPTGGSPPREPSGRPEGEGR
ncbi:MAG: CoA transferase [Thermoanaerobaculia bacterium]|nr:CoA transferase [Thermoanaerobaculia bacterium]